MDKRLARLTVYSSDDNFCYKQVENMITRYRNSFSEVPKSGQNKVSVKVVLAKELNKKYNPENENDKSDGEGEDETEVKDFVLPSWLLPDEKVVFEQPADRLFEIERLQPSMQ